jgi:hydroxyethylthiazole kinase-like uncharacterized protein yjeF
MKRQNRPRNVKGQRMSVPRRPDSHKGQNGRVLVTGGSKDYVGAPALAGLAALRAGCDIVRIAAPEKTAWAINALSPDLITIKLKGEYISSSHSAVLTKAAAGSDAVLIGPGMSLARPGTWLSSFVERLSKSGKNTILDADALKMILLTPGMKNVLITPHQEELETLLKNNRKGRYVRFIKEASGPDEKIYHIQCALKDFLKHNCILLKGPKDVIITDGKTVIIKGGNAGMTVGGTGDVLAGLCAGYAAQGLPLFEAAALASRECKRIGDLLLKKSNFGFGFISSDFIREIKKRRKQRDEVKA